jgi:uncharacterized membrane protein
MRVLFRSNAVKNLVFGYSKHALAQFAVFDELLSYRKCIRIGSGGSDIFKKYLISSLLLILVLFIAIILTDVDGCDVLQMSLRIPMNPSLTRLAIFLIIH